LHNVEVTSTENFEAYGEVALQNGILLDDNVIGQGQLPGWNVGDVIDIVRGAISYSYGAYRINPRDMNDFEAVVTDPGTDPDAGATDGADTSSGGNDDVGPEADGG
jgi:5'-nucleotidase/UDP-sugar diphosphatase